MSAKPLADRFWAKVDKGHPSGCWLWTGARKPSGYGQIYDRGRPRLAHLISLELAGSPRPDDLVTDHLCRVRHCVNPAHLEAVTFRENCLRGVGASATNARKVTCSKGHPLRLATSPSRGRRCLLCDNEGQKRRRAAKRALIAARAT